MRNIDDTASLFAPPGRYAAGSYHDIFRLEQAPSFSERWPLLSLFDSSTIGLLDVPPVGVLPPLRRHVHANRPHRGPADDQRREHGNSPRVSGEDSARAKPLFIDPMPAMRADGPPLLIVAVLGTKGGVGATTVTANLAAALSYGGMSVVALDLDRQNSLHLHFGLDPVDISGVARASLANEPWSTELRQAVAGRLMAHDAPQLQVLPHGLLDERDAERFNGDVAGTPGWLTHHLGKLRLPHGTVVLIDLPARAGALTAHVLQAAHVAISVTLADAASYVCMPQVDRLVRSFCLHRPDFLGYRCLFNQVDHSSELGHDVARLLRSNDAEQLFGLVHRDQAVAEALACEMSVLDYDKSSQAASDLAACARRLAHLLADGNSTIRGTSWLRRVA